MIAAIREVMKPNWLDRAVGYVAPVVGARRMQARAAMALSGYIGARWDRRATKEWYVPSGTADDTLLPDSQTLRDRSRDLIRNTPLATGAVNTVVQNVVGGGLQLQARPEWEALDMSEDEADEWKAGVEREFRLWAEGTECDITRTQNFYGLQDLAGWPTLVPPGFERQGGEGLPISPTPSPAPRTALSPARTRTQSPASTTSCFASTIRSRGAGSRPIRRAGQR